MCISDNLPDTLLLFEQICITIFVCSHGGDACETTRQRPAALIACGLYHSVSVCAGDLYYLIQYRRYQCVPGYEVKRDFWDMYLCAYVRSHTAGGVWIDV